MLRLGVRQTWLSRKRTNVIVVRLRPSAAETHDDTVTIYGPDPVHAGYFVRSIRAGKHTSSERSAPSAEYRRLLAEAKVRDGIRLPSFTKSIFVVNAFVARRLRYRERCFEDTFAFKERSRAAPAPGSFPKPLSLA